MKRLVFYSILSLILVSCGNNDNRVGDGQVIFGANGSLDGASLAQRYQAVLQGTANACVNGVARTQTGFRFREINGYPEFESAAVNFDITNLQGVTGVYIGSTAERDIVLVKDYGTLKEVIISSCNYSNFGSIPVSQVQFRSFLNISSVTSCNIDQISGFEFDLYTQNGGFRNIYVAPVNTRGAIPGVCQFSFYDDQVI